MIDPLTNLVSETPASEDHRLRREFYAKVLNVVPVTPGQDLQTLCRAWLEATGAEWVWLWLLYEGGEARPWEITATLSRSGKSEDYLPKNPAPDNNRQSVAEYCTQVKRALFVTNPATWRG